MDVEIVEAGEALKSVVLNLARFYIYDFTEFIGFQCGQDGLFHPGHWDKYWTQPGHWAFLVKVDGELAGFAMVEADGTQADTQFSIGEFFVLRKFRHRGLGQQTAFSVFDRFRGRWEVRQAVQNVPATAFWRKVIERYTGGRYRELPKPVRHGKWLSVVQTFDNTEVARP